MSQSFPILLRYAASVMNVRQFFRWNNFLGYWLVIAGLFGLLASFSLTYEKLQTLEHPGYQPSCNISPILSCQSVMSSPQAEVLGIPNPIFGIAAFTALITLGALMVMGIQLRRRVWLLAQVFAVMGLLFMHYLFLESVFVIHAICPWCFGIWMVTIPVFWGITVYNVRERHFGTPRRAWLRHLYSAIDHHGAMILASWYVLIFIILFSRFFDYWSTFL